MKRSEMIKKLTLPLSLIGGGLYTSAELETMASNLLKIMEDAGMSPPEHSKVAPGPHEYHDEIPWIKVKGWESES